MYKHILFLIVSIVFSIAVISGCDSGESRSGDFNGSTDSDEIKFELPETANNSIESYKVELVNPVTKQSLGIQEGYPGEMLIFEIDEPLVYVNAILTALDSGGEVLSSSQVAVVDVDINTPNCAVVVETSSITDNNDTKVNVDVECLGSDINFGFDNQDEGEPKFNFEFPQFGIDLDS